MAEVNLQPKPGWACLDREHKEEVLICFEQREACQKALDQAAAPPADWGGRIVAIAIGLAAGYAIASQGHR